VARAARWSTRWPGAGTWNTTGCYLLLRTLRLPVVFALSIPVAFPAPTVAALMWLLIPLSGAVIDRAAPFEQAEEPA
jgi:multisubunit Na+/H+ antiporter MnhG subunit